MIWYAGLNILLFAIMFGLYWMNYQSTLQILNDPETLHHSTNEVYAQMFMRSFILGGVNVFGVIALGIWCAICVIRSGMKTTPTPKVLFYN